MPKVTAGMRSPRGLTERSGDGRHAVSGRSPERSEPIPAGLPRFHSRKTGQNKHCEAIHAEGYGRDEKPFYGQVANRLFGKFGKR
jgi:hypothetical protein